MTEREAIREEYITGEVSLRDLSDKYRVNLNTIKSRSRKEGWVRSRREYRKAMGLPAEPEKERAATPQIRHRDMPVYVPTEETRKRVQKMFEASDLALERALLMLKKAGTLPDLRAAVTALQGIKEIQMIRSALDEEEQLARIEKLKAEIRQQEQAAQPKRPEPLEVVFLGRTEQASR